MQHRESIRNEERGRWKMKCIESIGNEERRK
jgi:hypothetical protein